MYKLVFESEELNVSATTELENLEDIYDFSKNKINIERYNLADIYNQVDYGINILKPTKDNEDFLFIYTHPIFWDYFKPNIHEELIGRKFIEIFNDFNKFNFFKDYKNFNYNNSSLKSLFKLYDGDKLIKVWELLSLKDQDLLYICIKDNTDFYIEKVKEDTIFNYSAFPILEVNREFRIIRVNKAYEEFLGYNLEEINALGTGSTLESFQSLHYDIEGLLDSLELIFNKTINYDDARMELVIKSGEHKWINAHLRLLNDDIVQITLHDLTEFKKIQNNAVNLNEYLTDIEELSKTCLTIKSKDGYYWSDEVYNLFELDSKIESNFTKTNILTDLIEENDFKNNKEIMEDLTLTNPVIMDFDITTFKGNVKHLKSFVKLKKEEDDILRLQFLQDITEETLAKKSAIELQKSINQISDLSKIVIASFEDGLYSWTSEIYNILKINPEDYSAETNLLDEFISHEDYEFYYNSLENLSPENNTFVNLITLHNNEGDLVYLNCNLIANFNKDGLIKSLHAFMQDVTEETLAKKSAIELQNNLESIQNISKIVIGKYEDGKYSWTSEIYNILMISPEDYPSDIDLIEEFVIPEEKGLFKERLKELTPENPNLHKIRSIKLLNGETRIIEGFVEAEFDENNDLYSFVTFFSDETDKIKKEMELKQLSENRKILLQEVHHRVKNNLQLILSFLSLETRFNKDNPVDVLNQTHNRIGIMANTHEAVYQSPTVSTVDLESFLNNNLGNLFALYTKGNITLHSDLEPVNVDTKISIPLGLLVNELALNTIKYAFPESGMGDFYINLIEVDDKIVLKIWDNGVGLNDNVNLFTSESLGFIIIRNLTQQLDGDLTILKKDSGFGVKLVIPF